MINPLFRGCKGVAMAKDGFFAGKENSLIGYSLLNVHYRTPDIESYFVRELFSASVQFGAFVLINFQL
jgi:hypothetical protein